MSNQPSRSPWVDADSDGKGGFPAPVEYSPEYHAAPPSQIPAPVEYPQHPPAPAQQQANSAGGPYQPGSRTGGLMSRLDTNAPTFDRPDSGMRRFIYDLTGGRWNLGLSPEGKARKNLIQTISEPLPGQRVYHVGVFSQKGGVAKTSTSAGVGATLGMYRTDKVLGLDVNPDGGSLGIRVPATTPATILDLRDQLARRDLTPMEFDTFVNHNPKTRFDTILLTPGVKPEVPLTAADYEMISAALQEKYPYRIVLIDCGTNLTSPVMDGIIPRLDLLVNATTTLRDEASVTLGGLDALDRDGYGDLVANSISIVTNKLPRVSDVQEQRDIDRVAHEVRSWFGESTRTVVNVPYDAHIGRGEVIDMERLRPETSMAFLQAAAEIVTALSELR